MVLQRNYGYLSDTPAFAGMLADDGAVTGRQVFAKANSGSMVKQTIGTLTVTKGANAGDFTITVVGTAAGGRAFTSAVVVPVLAGDDATASAVKIVTALNANENINDVAIASNAAGVITLTVRYFGVSPITSVTGAATGVGNAITAAPTVTPHTEASIIPFGYAVGRYAADTDEEVQRITTATGLTIVGIAKKILQVETPYPYNANIDAGYVANSTIEVYRRGRMWVPTAAAVVRDTPAFFVSTTGQFTTTGVGTAFPTATYLTSTTGAGLALVEINLP